MACEAPLRGGWTKGGKVRGSGGMNPQTKGKPSLQDSEEIKNPSLLYEVTDSL